MSRRPRLVYSGPGMTPAAIAEEAAIEDRVRRDEARTHVAHLRLLAKQLGLWDADTSARMLLRLADGYARKWADEPKRAA